MTWVLGPPFDLLQDDDADLVYPFTMRELLGIIEDVVDGAPGIPVNARQTLVLNRGSDQVVNLTVRFRSGPIYIPVTGDAIVLTLRQAINGAAIVKTATASLVRGLWLITITVADMKHLDPVGNGGRWLFDTVLIRNGGIREMLIPVSYAEVVATVSVLP